MFTKAHHWSLSWYRCIQFKISRPFSLRSHIRFPLPIWFKRNIQSPRPCVKFRNKLFFYSDLLLASRRTYLEAFSSIRSDRDLHSMQSTKTDADGCGHPKASSFSLHGHTKPRLLCLRTWPQFIFRESFLYSCQVVLNKSHSLSMIYSSSDETQNCYEANSDECRRPKLFLGMGG